MGRSRYILAVLGTAALVLGPVSVGLSAAGLDTAYAKNGGNGGGNGNGGGGGNGNGNGNGGGGSAGKGASGKSGAAGKGASSGSAKAAAKNARKAPTVDAVVTASVRPPRRGALASELGALNAAHASAQAFANASDNSRVGQIRAYAEAYEAETLAAEDAAAAAAEVARLAGLTPDEIAAEFPDPVGYDQSAYDAAVAEAEAAAAISGDRTAVDALAGLTPEERAAAYPSSWDPAVAQAEAIAEAAALQAMADAEAAAAASLADAALAAAGGADLSDEALDYLHDLLEGKVPPAATEEGLVEAVADDPPEDAVAAVE